MNNLHDNYQRLVERVDALCRDIQSALHEQITCGPGCSSCCTAITIFPVEAAALTNALEALPADQAASIRQQVRGQAEEERCPLLSNHHCLLYDARPLICRTHGLPILFTEEGQQRLDCCPRNLEECDSLPGSAVVDLDRLNALLVAVNALYLSQTDSGNLPERVTIAQAVLRHIEPSPQATQSSK